VTEAVHDGMAWQDDYVGLQAVNKKAERKFVR
jgi:hypothetical protein